jgi:diguanylate cyclase (GGDEF)-like protein
VVELTFVIAVLNISLGFALAVYLGYGPSELAEPMAVLRRYRLSYLSWRTKPAPLPPPRLVEAPSEEMISSTLEELLDTGDPDELNIEPHDEPYDADTAELLCPVMPDQWDMNEKYVETSILRLNLAMIKSGLRVMEIDTRLRANRETYDEEVIGTCLRLLREDSISYLAEQSEASEKFRARLSELGELSSLGDAIEMSNLEQTAQVETTLNNLEYMDFHSDPKAANQRLLEEIKNLQIARHRLRDEQEAAFVTIARYEKRVDKIEKQLFADPLTNLRTRIGLEVAINQWWRQGRQKSRPVSAALFDVDRFGKINEDFGPLIGDRILTHIGKILKEGIGKADLVGRFAGQRFLIITLDAGSRATLKTTEFLRQTVEKSTFIHEDARIQVTVSAAFTEVKPDDWYEAVLERLEETMEKVKQAGPNHTFLHNGKNIEPVQSPNFGAQNIEITI